MSSTPAFQFYPQDFLVGTADMTPEEVGAYIRLLCYQWSKEGLPNDQAKCASMAGCHGNAIASIWHKFGICEDGKVRNSRLEKVRDDSRRYSEKQAKNAQKRWEKCQKDAKTMPPQSHGIKVASVSHVPEGCPSPSSSKEEGNSKSKKVVDADWIAEKSAMECFRGIDLTFEVSKARAWCEENNRECTPRFMLNWLNRAATDMRSRPVKKTPLNTLLNGRYDNDPNVEPFDFMAEVAKQKAEDEAEERRLCGEAE